MITFGDRWSRSRASSRWTGSLRPSAKKPEVRPRAARMAKDCRVLTLDRGLLGHPAAAFGPAIDALDFVFRNDELLFLGRDVETVVVRVVHLRHQGLLAAVPDDAKFCPTLQFDLVPAIVGGYEGSSGD